MDSIDDILEQHFFPEELEGVKSTLNEFGFDELLHNGYNNLIELKTDNLELQLHENSQFGVIIASTFNSINEKVAVIENPATKSKVEKVVSEVTIRLLLELVRELETEIAEITPHFDEIIRASCLIYGYDYNAFKEYINPNELLDFSQELSGTKSAAAQKEIRKNTISMQTGLQAENELVAQIKKKRNWVRKPNRWFKLLNNPDDNLEIVWSSDYLEELAYLIYQLKEEGFIVCNGNRGSFAAVEKHLYDFNGIKTKKGRLKTLSHRINKNWEQYEQRLLPVKQIIKEVKQKSCN